MDPDSGDSDDDAMMDDGGAGLAAAGGMAAPGGSVFAFAFPGANLTEEGTCDWAPLPPVPLTPLCPCSYSVYGLGFRVLTLNRCAPVAILFLALPAPSPSLKFSLSVSPALFCRLPFPTARPQVCVK